MNRLIYLLIIVISFLVGCNNGDSNHTEQEVIRELITKYPELVKDTTEGYKLIRTVIIKDRKIEVKLYLCKHDYTPPHAIVVIKNELGKNCAIPLFSNSERKYWNFENEEKTYHDNTYNSLFEKEFILAINQLNLNDTLGTGRIILGEIFHSLLHFEFVNEHDKEFLLDLGTHSIDSKSHSDNDSECDTRNETNCNQILKKITPEEYFIHLNAYFDSRNYRVFQLDFPTRRKEKIKELNLKIYRFGCEIQPLFM